MLRYETVFPPYFEGAPLGVPGVARTVADGRRPSIESPDAYPVDARGVTDYCAFFSVKHLGAGQFYLMASKDKDGEPLDGGKTYRLDRAGRSAGQAILVGDGLRPRHPRADPRRVVAEQLVADARPEDQCGRHGRPLFRPQGARRQGGELDPDQAGGRFEVLFRLYGPEKPLFDKTWMLPDIVRAE